MSAITRTIAVLGSGPGIGNHVGAAFAAHGFKHVVLLARNEQRLEEDKAAVISKSNSNVKVDVIKTDLSDIPTLKETLEKVESVVGGVPEVVFYNAARIQMADPLSVPIEEIEEDLKTTTIGLYAVAQWAIPKLQGLAKNDPTAKPSLLVTNSFLPADPIPQLLSLSVSKAAQKNMVTSLSKAYGPSGVHLGCIIVGGVVSPEAKQLNPTNIAEKTWGLYNQEKDKWELGVDIFE